MENETKDGGMGALALIEVASPTRTERWRVWALHAMDSRAERKRKDSIVTTL